eukprot:TRINITY_DN755_c1_g1_i1.p1 TRINITY_DN755_c1_g1~~TRINITY_DN755_c1_g1_i1.p1  ORF type:complete len:399 (+),score=70.54 TRINITY_DN755_c1_g1_i1:61-1257(+)
MAESGRVAAHQKRKLYAANLGPAATIDYLKEVFGVYGDIVEAHILNRKGRGGRLSGFVTFATVEAAQRAVADKQEWYPDGDNQKVTIKLADVKGGSLDDDTPRKPPYKLYVSNLPPTSTTEYIKEIFGSYGELTDCYMINNRGRGDRRSAFITYSKLKEAEEAVKSLSDQLFDDDQRLTVRWAEPPKNKPAPASNNGMNGNGAAALNPNHAAGINGNHVNGVANAPGNLGIQPNQQLPLAAGQLAAGLPATVPLAGLDQAHPHPQSFFNPAMPFNSLQVDQLSAQSIVPFMGDIPIFQNTVTPTPAQTAATQIFKLYIANLPSDYDEKKVYDLFSCFGGKIENVVLLDRKRSDKTGRSGFVWVQGTACADVAIKTLHNNKPPGCVLPITVKLANAGRD